MAAPKGNQFWKLKTKYGRGCIFNTSEELWKAASEYFQWCDENPWTVRKTKIKKGEEETEETPTHRPYTLSGLLTYINISDTTWYKLKKLNNNGFIGITTRIDRIIETNQLEGAMVGAYNPNIVARKLGLADKTEHTGKDGEPLMSNPVLNITVVSSDYELHESEEDISDV